MLHIMFLNMQSTNAYLHSSMTWWQWNQSSKNNDKNCIYFIPSSDLISFILIDDCHKRIAQKNAPHRTIVRFETTTSAGIFPIILRVNTWWRMMATIVEARGVYIYSTWAAAPAEYNIIKAQTTTRETRDSHYIPTIIIIIKCNYCYHKTRMEISLSHHHH